MYYINIIYNIYKAMLLTFSRKIILRLDQTHAPKLR